MEIFNARRLTRIGVSAALYIVLTLVAAPIAFEAVQFRVSEMLMLLCFYDRDYILAMTIGCFISNMFSSLGMIDMLFGTTVTLLAAICIYAFRKKLKLPFVSLFPVFFNAVIIGLEIKIVSGDPFWVNAGFVALGEFVCVTVFGVIVFKLLEKNKAVMKMITSEPRN